MVLKKAEIVLVGLFYFMMISSVVVTQTRNIDLSIILSIYFCIFLIIYLIYLGGRDYFKLFMVLLLCVPFQQFHLFKEPFALTVFNGLLIILFCIIQLGHHTEFVNHILWNRQYLFKVTSLCCIVFVINSFMPFLYSPYKKIAIGMFFNAVGIAVLFFTTVFAINSISKLRLSINILIFIGVVCGLVGILQLLLVIPQFGYVYVDRFDFNFDQSLGIIKTRGSYGMLLNAAISFLCIRLFWNNGVGALKRVFNLCLLGVLTTAVIISQSRSTYFAYIVNLCSIIIGVTFTHRRSYFFVLLILAILIGSYSGTISSVPHELVEAQRLSVYSRIEVNKKVINEIFNSPLAGTGKDISFREDYKYGYYRGKSALHNGFLEILRYGGLMLFLPYFGIMFFTFIMLIRLIIRHRKADFTKYALGLFCALMACMVELNFYMGISEKMMWFLFAFANALYIIVIWHGNEQWLNYKRGSSHN